MMVAKEVHDKAQDPMAWFQHDSNAAQDQKCQRLLFRYGNAGYGAFWRLCEILANTTTHSLPVETDEDWLILAEQIGMRKAGAFDEISSVDDCKDFISCLLEIGLLTRDGKARGCRKTLFISACKGRTEPKAGDLARTSQSR